MKLYKLFVKKEKSDIEKVRITSSGAFYMKSEDLFNDKKEALDLIEKLDKSISNYMKVNSKKFVSGE
jgi:hypothetical protein